MTINKRGPSGEPTDNRQDDSVEPLVTYSPLPSQHRFHASEAPFKGFSGPVGSGKSAALCHEAISLALTNPECVGVIASPTYTMLRDIVQVALFTVLDGRGIEYRLYKALGRTVLAGSDSTLLLRSLDSPERLRGTNLAWFGLDELSYTKEESWLRMCARLREPAARRLCGFAVWTPKGSDWVHARFIKNAASDYECVQAKPFENKFVLDANPNYYERLEETYDPRFYRQEVLGEYLSVSSNRAYHAFDPRLHVVVQKLDPNEPLLWALDFNVAPMSSLIVQRQDDRLRVLDEISLKLGTTQEACEEFLNRYALHANNLRIFGDATGHRRQTTGFSDYDALTRALVRGGARKFTDSVPAANPPVLNRVNAVNGVLTNALGEVRLEIDPRCKELICDLEEVSFKPDTGVLDKDKDPMRTHMSDALGYMIWALYGDKNTIGERSQPLRW
jgi:hypothetical protein